MSVTSWDERQLCPDGACIGVIGPNGQCRKCGKVAPNWGDERRRGLKDDGAADDAGAADDTGAGDAGGVGKRVDADAGDDHDDDDDFDADGDAPEDRDVDDAGDHEGGSVRASNGNGDADHAPAHDVDEWETRSLCPDETCIGVIGASGTCGVCGKSRA